MLIRITLAVKGPALLKELQGVLTRPDILLQLPKTRKGLWERVTLDPADVLIVSQAFLPSPLRQKIDELENYPDSPTMVVLSDSADPVVHSKLLGQGCDAVLFTGLAVEQVREVIEVILEKRQRLTRKRFFTPLPLAEPRLSDFLSESPAMGHFVNMVPRVVASDAALLIDGETGVGKERLASAIHSEGPRCDGRFVALNCGALPEQLLESELFGHVRGAFTGATASRRGWFELAHKGTIFLDEIGEIPLHLQVKLLRVLQEHEIQPIGSEKTFGVDVRVIAACNRPLETEVQAGRFRRDLFHRLSVVTVTIPPLRSRLDDIPALAERHLIFLAKQIGRHVTGISAQAVQAMCRYSWPGNVRELNNVIERAILLCDDIKITLDDLPESFHGTERPRPVRAPSNDLERAEPLLLAPESQPPDLLRLPMQWLAQPLQEMRETCLSDLERQYIEGLLLATKGRIGETARRAGLKERSLYDKMKRLGLRKEDYRLSVGSASES